MSLGVDVNWERLCIEGPAAKRLSRILQERVGRFYMARVRRRTPGFADLSLPQRRHRALAFIGSHENPGGVPNTHWLYHVPEGFQGRFIAKMTATLRKLTGVDDLGRAFHNQAIDCPGAADKYILKGINPVYAAHFHMTAVDQGFIPGRGRTFVSHSIGWTARKAVGWKRKRRPGPRPPFPAFNRQHASALRHVGAAFDRIQGRGLQVGDLAASRGPQSVGVPASGSAAPVGSTRLADVPDSTIVPTAAAGRDERQPPHTPKRPVLGDGVGHQAGWLCCERRRRGASRRPDASFAGEPRRGWAFDGGRPGRPSSSAPIHERSARGSVADRRGRRPLRRGSDRRRVTRMPITADGGNVRRD